MSGINRSLKYLVKPLNGFNPTEDIACFFKCLPVTLSILIYKSIHRSLLCIETQRLFFVKQRIWVLLNNSAHLILKLLHPLCMTSDAGESVADGRIARFEVANNPYRGFVQPVASSIYQIVRLQTVGKIEDNLATIMFK